MRPVLRRTLETKHDAFVPNAFRSMFRSVSLATSSSSGRIHAFRVERAKRLSATVRISIPILQSLSNDPIVWATPADARNERCWLASHTTTLLNHLRNCDRVPRNVREDAAAKLGKPLQLAPSRLTTSPPSSLPSIGSHSSSSICRPSLAMSTVSTPTLSSLSSATLVASDSEAPFPGLVHPYAERTIMPQLGYGAAAPQVSRNQRRALARVPSLAQPPPWTSETQRRFESRIARVTASANIPLSWVDDPEVQAFFADFIPAARPISRRVLTSRLLPTELDAQRAILLPRIQGGEATLQCDGWSAGNFHHYTGFTLTVKKEVCVIHSESR